MILSEITIISFVLYVVQVLLLPTQLVSYLELKLDKTRLRFLLLALSFVGFNSLWVAIKLLFQLDSSLSSGLLIYSGILLLAHLYYYITKELGLVSKKYSVLNLALLLAFTELLRECSLLVVASEFLPYVKLFFFLVFQVLVQPFSSYFIGKPSS